MVKSHILATVTEAGNRLRPRFGVNELGAGSWLVMLGDGSDVVGLWVGGRPVGGSKLFGGRGHRSARLSASCGAVRAMSARIYGHAGVLADCA